MPVLRPGDERFHHSDSSHRWSGGPADPQGQAAYQAALRDHVEAHRTGLLPAVPAVPPAVRAVRAR